MLHADQSREPWSDPRFMGGTVAGVGLFIIFIWKVLVSGGLLITYVPC